MIETFVCGCEIISNPFKVDKIAIILCFEHAKKPESGLNRILYLNKPHLEAWHP